MLGLAGQPRPALLLLGNEASSQALRSYFMQVFVGQSLCASDWECTGAVCSQPPPGEEPASSFTTFLFWCVSVVWPSGVIKKNKHVLQPWQRVEIRLTRDTNKNWWDFFLD